jgi:hypothetical protein
MYYITINVQYVRYSTGRKIKYFIVYRLSWYWSALFLIKKRDKVQGLWIMVLFTGQAVPDQLEQRLGIQELWFMVLVRLFLAIRKEMRYKSCGSLL